MQPQYIMHGWHLSYFSGKLRAYLRYKDLKFIDKAMTAYDLQVRAAKKTGAIVMPILQTDNNEWLQDTSVIISELENRHPENSVFPNSPKQFIAAQLIEAWADEWWVPIAMHYRWSYPENYALFEHDAAKALLPLAPRFLSNKLVHKIASQLRKYLPGVGVRKNQLNSIETWTHRMLDALEKHFSQHLFLLGDKPCIGDFALVGPLYGHLNRDPLPKKQLLDTRPQLQAWVDRVHGTEKTYTKPNQGEYLPDDKIPSSLSPIFTAIFNEFYPMVTAIVEQLNQHVTTHSAKSGHKIPRTLDDINFPMADKNFKRSAMPYTVWMLQGVQKNYLTLTANDKALVDEWLKSFGQVPFHALDLGPKLERLALATKLA